MERKVTDLNEYRNNKLPKKADVIDMREWEKKKIQREAQKDVAKRKGRLGLPSDRK